MGDTNNEDTNSNVDNNAGTDNNDNGGATTNTSTNQTGDNQIDTEAFAELISEKDKQIEQLQNDVKMLKKSNADLTVKISAQNKPDKSIGETIVDFCDTRKVK